jgi:apolipoprotein N-acyltransferase
MRSRTRPFGSPGGRGGVALSIPAPTVPARVATSRPGGPTATDTSAPPREQAPGHRARWVLLLRLVAAVVAGALFAVAFPGYDVWIAAPASTAVLALALWGASGRGGALTGLVFGCAAMLPVLHWAGIYVGPVPWILLGVASGAFYAPFGALVSLATRVRSGAGRAWWPVVYAGLWVAVEAARSRVPFHGFPWARLAFSQSAAPDLSLASVGGAPLVSAAVALAGGLLATAVVRVGGGGSTRGLRRPLAVAVPVALAGVVVFGPALIPRPTAGQPDATGKTSVRIAMIQGNVDRTGLQTEAYPQQVLKNHLRLTLELAAEIRAGTVARPDFVMWPENASDDDPTVNPAVAAELSQAANAVGVPLVAGVILDGPGDHRRNAILVWNPGTGLDTSATGTYVKRYPAPFGEYIPLRSIARRVSSAVNLVPVDMVRGTKVGKLVVDPGRPGQVTLGPAICFEVAFDNVLRDGTRAGADLLIVPTNNATFGHSAESVQQLAMARLRAVEHGRAVLSDSTVGVSAVIMPDGRLVGETKLFTPAIVTATVPLRQTLTIADRVGAWPELALSVVGLAGAAVGWFSGIRRRRRTEVAR